MIRIKTLSLPLITTLVYSAVQPAIGQVSLALSSQKTYRQDKNSIDFKGGSFKIRFDDGSITTIPFCNDPNYYPPGTYIGVCSPGTTGFVTLGNINGATIQRPYLLVTGLQQAVVVEPLEADRIKLTAAPASKLPRPSGGFKDDSVSVFYNLTVPNSINEYGVTGYYRNRNYNENQRSKFDSEIVTGVYQYSFPRLNRPNLPAVIKAVIYPMAEGLIKKNNRETGFEFTSINKNKWYGSCAELSYSRPNVIKWTGLTPSTVYAAVDKLYFSMKVMRNPNDPRNTDVIGGSAVFPAFSGAASDTRVLLANPYVNTFTVPPIIRGATKAMVQLDLERNFQTGGVTYDFSTRRFQIPVVVINRFSEYASIYLANVKNPNILADTDGDGYNNLTEWILDSEPNDEGSVPIPPFPADYQAVNIIGGPTAVGSYYGFNVDIKRGTIPAVRHTLQFSKDQGATWQTFKSGYYLLDGTFTTVPPVDATGELLPHRWSVERVTTIERGITTTEIQVRSGTPNLNINATIPTIQPVGTIGDIYRVKVTLDN